MPLQSPISEARLRSFLSPAQFQRAEAHLAAGKLIGRCRPEEGGIAALWDWSPNAYSVVVLIEGGNLFSTCDCGRNQDRNMCEHVATLLLACVRDPGSFVDTDEMGEALADLEGDMRAARAPQPARAAGLGAAAPMALQGLALPPVEGTETLRLAPPEMHSDFLRLLGDLSASALRDLAGRHSVPLSGRGREDLRGREALLDGLAEALSRPAAWRGAWDKLSPLARLVLAVLALRHQPPTHLQVAALRQMVQSLMPAPSPQWETALQELGAAGLAFVDRYGALNCPVELPGSLPPAPGFLATLKAGAEGTPRTAPGPLDFPMFATRLLLVLQAEGPRLRARPEPPPHPLLPHLPMLQGWPLLPSELDALAREPNPGGAAYRKDFTVATAPSPLSDEARAAVARSLNGGNGERLDFALRLLTSLKLVELTPGQPVKVFDVRLTDFLRMAPAQRLILLINAWLGLTTWTEFDRLAARRPPILLRHPGSGYGSSYSDMLAELALARLGVLHQVRQAPEGSWSDVSALAARARSLNAHGLVWPATGIAWYPDWNKRHPNLTQSRDWDAIYGPYVEAVLTGPLSWLGLVELGYNKEQLRGFRLTPLGAFVFRHVDSYTLPSAPSAGRALMFESDGTLSLHAEYAGSDALTLLSLMGSLEGGARGELRYTLSPAGASRAFEAGWEVDRILATLREAAGSAPPRVLAERLRHWREGFGSVQVYSQVALLELADDYALNELLAGTSLSQHMLYRFSPRLVALNPDGVSTLLAELEKKGYTPKVVAPHPQPFPPEGRTEPPHPRPFPQRGKGDVNHA